MTAKVEKTARDWCEAWNSHEVDRILSYVTDDIVYEGLAGARVMSGIAEMRAYLNETFSAFPDFEIDLKSLFASGRWAGSEWIMSGTFKGELQFLGLKPTGKSFSVRGASITELRGAKVRRNTDYYDGAVFFRQIGITP